MSQTGSLNGLSGSVANRLALFGPSVHNGEWYRLITGGFVHAGLLHIAGNMILLYAMGQMLEPALGHARMAALYFAALLAGSFGVMLVSPHAYTVGASGAVFGLFGAAAVGMRQRGISVWQSGIGALILINLVFTFAVPGISIGGHVGGLAGGALVGGYMLRTPPSRRAAIDGTLVAAAVAGVSIVGALAAAGR